MSTKVVVPERIISRAARRVPAFTKAAVTLFFSAGKMYFCSHSISRRSSAMPRKRTMAAWVWAFTRPGRTMPPPASSSVRPRCARVTSAAGPTATMRPCWMATAPSAITRRDGSTVTTVAFFTTRSTSAPYAPAETESAAARRTIFAVMRLIVCGGRGPRPRPGCRRSEVAIVERQGQEALHGPPHDPPPEVADQHFDVAAELPEDLPAGAARRGGRTRGGDDGDGREAAEALRDRLEHRHPLRAHGEPVGRVLHVAAGEDRKSTRLN